MAGSRSRPRTNNSVGALRTTVVLVFGMLSQGPVFALRSRRTVSNAVIEKWSDLFLRSLRIWIARGLLAPLVTFVFRFTCCLTSWSTSLDLSSLSPFVSLVCPLSSSLTLSCSLSVCLSPGVLLCLYRQVRYTTNTATTPSVRHTGYGIAQRDPVKSVNTTIATWSMPTDQRNDMRKRGRKAQP